MKNQVNKIKETHKFLNNIYELTKNGYVDEKHIKSEGLTEYNIKSLLKNGLLHKFKDKYKWNGTTPNFVFSFNYYYNKIRKINKNYADIVKLLDDPSKYTTDEILEAISIKNIVENSFNKKNTDNKSDNLLNISENNVKNNSSNVDKDDFEKYTNGIKDLLEKLIEITIDNSKSVRNAQNSISTIIAILKTNQENIFDISASQHEIIKNKYLELLESSKNNPSDIEKLESVKNALKHLKSRIVSNANIVNKYKR